MEEVILEKLTNIERLLEGQDKPLTLREAAEFTGLSKSTIYKLTCKNQIPYYRPTGGRAYFDRRELREWLLRNRIKTAEEVDAEATDRVVGGRHGN